jgi:hypothetical protein
MANIPGFDESGKPIPKTTKATAPAEGAASLPGFETNETHFHGMLRMPHDHELIPDKSIAERYQLDLGSEFHENTIKLFARGHYCAYFGETGCGKTEIVKYLCAGAGIPLFSVQGHFDLTWDDLVGRCVPDEETKSGFKYVDGPLTIAMELSKTRRVCFLLDEAASVKQGLLNGLNELANGGDLAIDSQVGHRIVKNNKHFQVIITANPWTGYEGNNPLSMAFLRRFKVRQFKYLTQENEIALLSSMYPVIPWRVIHNLVTFANKTRALKEKSDSVRYVVDLGTLKHVCDMIAEINVSPLQAVDDCVFGIVSLVAPDELQPIHEMAKTLLNYDKVLK